MTLDILLGCIFILLVALGWRSGAMRQVVRAAAAVVLVLAAPFAAPWVREAVFQNPDIESPLVEFAALILAGIGIYAAVALSGWLVIKALHTASRTLTLTDRLSGAALSTIKAILIIYFIVAGFVLLKPAINRLDPNHILHLTDGRVLTWVEANNFVAPWHFPNLVHLRHSTQLAACIDNDEQKAKQLRQTKDAADFLRSTDFQKLFADQELRSILLSHQYAFAVADSRVREKLNDPDWIERLNAVSWVELLNGLHCVPAQLPKSPAKVAPHS